ncbi:MAG: hypothetical protein WCR55_04070 [Lentisphaerota bacterium]
MADDTVKNIKIKLSLNDLVPKTAETPKANNPLAEIEKASAELKLKPSINLNPALPIELPQKNIEPVAQVEERPKISIKKPLLQDIKPKVTLAADGPPKTLVSIPAYAKSNVPNQEESKASSPSLIITEDVKGKTQKILEPQPARKPIIDLNALNIKLDREPPTKEAPPALVSENVPNIDFEYQDSTRKKNISDTVRLKIRPQATPGGKIFSDAVKETLQEPPSLIPNSQEIKLQDSFTIPQNVTPNIPVSGNGAKKKPNWIIIGILGVLLILIVYFMIITIRTLSA